MACAASSDDDGELVGPVAVRAPEYEIADFSGHILRDAAVDGIFEIDARPVRDAQADRRVRASRSGNAGAMDTTLRQQIAAAAMAFEGGARGQQAVQRLPVQRAALALPHDRFIRDQAECRQRPQLRVGRTCHLARRIEILDPHQPIAAAAACGQPAAERGHQRSEMQRSRGRGRKTPPITDGRGRTRRHGLCRVRFRAGGFCCVWVHVEASSST